MSGRAIALIAGAGVLAAGWILYKPNRSPVAPLSESPTHSGGSGAIGGFFKKLLDPEAARPPLPVTLPKGKPRHAVDPLFFAMYGDRVQKTIPRQRRRTRMSNRPALSPEEDQATINDAWQGIKKHEGFRRAPYYDTLGFKTVGFGFKIADPKKLADSRLRPLATGAQPRIEPVEANAIGRDITAKTHNEVAGLFKPATWAKLSRRQRTALVNMGYQLGAAGLGRFRRTIGLLDAGRYREAGLEAGRSQWAIQTPNRAAEIAIDLSNGQLNRKDLPWVETAASGRI